MSAVWLYVDWHVATDVLEGLFAAILKVTQKDLYRYTSLFFQGATATWEPGPPHCRGYTFTVRHTTFSRTPLDGWSARLRDLCLTTHNIHKWQISMPPGGFKPTIPANERPLNHSSDRAAKGIGTSIPTYKVLSQNTSVCLFVFLALQPIVVVFSQLDSGL
jgi:hypothetical protein